VISDQAGSIISRNKRKEVVEKSEISFKKERRKIKNGHEKAHYRNKP
jgi:hypothetical protein